MTRENARLRETVRKLNEEFKSGANESIKAADRWASSMERLRAQANKTGMDMTKLSGASAPFRREIETFKLSFAGLTREQNTSAMSMAGLLGMFGRFAGPAAIVAGGVRLATSSLASYRQELEGLADKQRAFNASLTAGVALTSDAGRSKEISAALGSIPGVKQEDALNIYQSVRREAPTAPMSRVMGITQSLAQLSATGADVRPAASLAAQLEGVMPGVKPEDVADRAVLLQRQAGGDFAKLGGDEFNRAIFDLIKSGAMTPDEALGAAGAAAGGKISAKTLIAAARTSGASAESLMPERGARGAVATAKRKLAGMSARERFSAMQSDQQMREIGMGEQALDFSRLTGEDIASGAARMRGADSTDVIGGIAGEGNAGYTFQAAIQRRKRALAQQEVLLQQLDDSARLRVSNNFAGQAAGEAMVGIRKMGTGVFGGGSEEQILGQNAALQAIVSLLQQQVKATEKMAAQKVNVDAHTE